MLISFAAGQEKTTLALCGTGGGELKNTSCSSAGSVALATAPSLGVYVNIFDNTQLNYVTSAAVAAKLRPSDGFVLVSGNNGNRLDTNWLLSSAQTLRQHYPQSPIWAYTAGLSNVRAASPLLKGSPIKGIFYGYEPGMANEPEFSWDFAASLGNLSQVAKFTHASSLQAGTAASGRPLLESGLLSYKWDYGQISGTLDYSIIQTQTWAKAGTSKFQQAITLLLNENNASTARWLPQLTVDSTDGNGIDAQTAYTDSQWLSIKNIPIVSIWISDQTSYLGQYLGLLRP